MSIISSLFGLNHFTNKDEENQTEMEHFMSNGGIAGIIVGVIIGIIIFVVILYIIKFKKTSSAIKYLTSSTSPSFDLTFTPNL